MPPNLKSLISSAEACELLGIDRSTLTRWVAAGRINPAWQMPGETGARLFRRRDIAALKDSSAPDDTDPRDVPASS